MINKDLTPEDCIEIWKEYLDDLNTKKDCSHTFASSFKTEDKIKYCEDMIFRCKALIIQEH